MSEMLFEVMQTVRMCVNIVFLCILVFSLSEYRIEKKRVRFFVALTTVLSVLANAICLIIFGIEILSKLCLITTTIPLLALLIIITKDGIAATLYNFWFQTNVFCIIWFVVGCGYYFFKMDIIADIIIRIVIYLFCCGFFTRHIKQPYRFFVSNVKVNWISIGILPMLLTVVFFSNRTIFTSSEQDPRQLIYGGVIILLMIVTHYVIIRTYGIMYKSMEQSKIEENLEHQISMQKEQYEQTTELINEQRIMRHDMRHHMLMILSLLNDGNDGTAKKYVEALCKNGDEITIKTYTENPAINSVLSHHIAAAEKRGINVFYRVNLPVELHIDEMKFCIVLSNLLENAAQNAITYMKLDVIQNGEQFCVNVENDYSGVRRKNEYGDYVSTTTGGSGLGLKSVKALISKLGGVIEINDDGKNFSVRVAINN